MARKSVSRKTKTKAHIETAPVNHLKPTDATASDFSSPMLGDAYEEFIMMLAMSAGSRARHRANDIRRTKGIEAAIKFIGQCPVETEPPDVLKAAGEPYSEVSLAIEHTRALADLIQMSLDNNEPEPASIQNAAAMAFNRMHKARAQLESLWVAIGGAASEERTGGAA